MNQQKYDIIAVDTRTGEEVETLEKSINTWYNARRERKRLIQNGELASRPEEIEIQVVEK